MAVDASAFVSTEAAQVALSASLSRLRAWVRLLLALRFTTFAAAGAAALLALLHGLGRLYGVAYSAESAVMPLIAAVVASALVAMIWPLPDRLMATSADRRLGLRDRLSTAVELSRAEAPSGMHLAQISDALRHLAQLTPSRAYPIRFDPMMKTMFGCVAALALVHLLPIPALLLSPQGREDREAMRLVAAEIKPVARELERAATAADDEEARELAERMRRLAERMEQGRLDKREALLELSELDEELERLDAAIKPPSLQTAGETAEQIGARSREEMARRAEEMAEQASRADDEELARSLRELAERAREASSAQEMRAVTDELEQGAEAMGSELSPAAMLDAAAMALSGEEWQEALEALEALQGMLQDGDRELSEAQARELAERMKELAQQLQGTELSDLAEALQEAGQCMSEGDCQGAAQRLAQGTSASSSGLGAVALEGEVQRMRQQADSAAQGLRRPGQSASHGQGAGAGGPGPQQRVPPNAPGATLYAPREAPVDADPQRVRGRVRPGGESRATQVQGAPDDLAPSRVPYYEVIGEYSRAAEDALQREEVPPAYRGTVRQYFDSLQTSGGEASEERNNE